METGSRNRFRENAVVLGPSCTPILPRQELRKKQDGSKVGSQNHYPALSWLHFHDPMTNYLVLGKEESLLSWTEFEAVNEDRESSDLFRASSGNKITPCLHLA